jgi:septal ring factor EnvC (AmiA/AmiB activator)
MSDASDRLASIRDELNTVLEERIAELLGHVTAAQEITRQIAIVEDELRAEQEASADARARLERMRDRQRQLLAGLEGLASGLKG